MIRVLLTFKTHTLTEADHGRRLAGRWQPLRQGSLPPLRPPGSGACQAERGGSGPAVGPRWDWSTGPAVGPRWDWSAAPSRPRLEAIAFLIGVILPIWTLRATALGVRIAYPELRGPEPLGAREVLR